MAPAAVGQCQMSCVWCDMFSSLRHCWCLARIAQVVKQGLGSRDLACSFLLLVCLCCLLHAGDVDVVLSYCHHCLNDSTLVDMLPFLHEKGVGVIGASPLAMGLLTKEVGREELRA
jgi:hypothetical protein